MRYKTANRPERPHRVAVLVYDGLSMLEFAVACEIFGPTRTATHGPRWYDLAVCGAGETIRYDNGLRLPVPARLATAARADTIVIPPCEDPLAVPGTVVDTIRRAHARGTRIVSLCTGAFVLARTGLLDGRRAVTHWDDCAKLASRFPAVTVDPAVLYIDDGDILTSAGSAASIDLCLHIVATDHGAEVATALARQLVVQPHRDGGQAQYIHTPMPALPQADALSETLGWMAEHLDQEVSIAELARRATMSQRSFTRHFTAATGATPYQWLLRQRIQHAQRLLEGTDLPVETIAAHAGLANATNLRKHFRRQLHTSPNAYRRAFQASAATPGRTARPSTKRR